MPKKKIPDEEKLKPLRIFAEEGPYGLTYLSILVQRKKLKAKKVGRNYYTTKIWFDAYMNKHARENKKAAPVMTDMNPVASVSVSDEDMVSKDLGFRFMLVILFIIVLKYSLDLRFELGAMS